jgi:hypothetical protein
MAWARLELSPTPIAQLVGCAVQTVRNVIHAFHTQGVAGLERQSNRPKPVAPILDAPTCERLQHLLHQSPRTYGKPTGVWTLALAAPVCYEHGVTARRMSEETIRRALPRLRTHGKRAKHGITSPAPQYARKKSGAIVGWPWRWGIPHGSSGVRRRPGGAVLPNPTAMPGQTTSHCA